MPIRTIGAGSAAGGGATTLIERLTLASDQTTITFSTIPATYGALRLLVHARTTDSYVESTVRMYFNNVTTAASYRYQQVIRGGLTSTTSGDESRIGLAAGANALANSWGDLTIDVLDYGTTTATTTAYSRGTLRVSASGIYVYNYGLNYESTDAVTRIDLVSYYGGDFVTGSIFSLYGVE